jgi:hypothetical protein
MHNSDVSTVVTALKELGKMSSLDVVYGIPATHKRLPVRHASWINLWDFALEAMKSGFDGAAIGRYHAFDSLLEDMHCSDSVGLVRQWHTSCIAPNAENKPAYRLLREYGAISVERASLARCVPYRRLMSVFPQHDGVPFAEVPVVLDIDLSPLIEEMKITYPLLRSFIKAAYVNEENGKLLLDYVNLVDSHDRLPNIVSILSEAE